MEKKFDIIGMENGILDLALQIDRIPETDSHTRLSNYLWQPGGNASNAIAAAARQGAKCSFMGAVGDDALGEFVRGDWAYHGVDTSHLMTKPGDTVTFSVPRVSWETGRKLPRASQRSGSGPRARRS